MFEVAAPATALFVFGRTGGNIIPETITITRAGRVEVDREPTGRILRPIALQHLEALAWKERFATLPSTIPGTGVLPDISTGFIIYPRHEVQEHGGCNGRFTTLYNALWRAAGVQ
jgi:hypothetical protein